MEVRGRVGKMPKRYAGIMPNFRQSGIDQSPSQVIRSADKAPIRSMFIEAAETDRLRPPHRYTSANVWPQFLPLKCGEVLDAGQTGGVLRVRSPLVVHQNQWFCISIGRTKTRDDRFDKVRRKNS